MTGQAEEDRFDFTFQGKELSLKGVPSEYIFTKIRETGTFYEVELLDKISEVATDREGLFVDVGANLGNHTVYFAQILERQVIAIEPEPKNASLLRDNVALNSLEDRVEVHNRAAMSAPGFVVLEQAIEGNRGTFSAKEAAEGIEAITLDSLVGDEHVALIKVDVEGAELEVLKGARKTILGSSPIVVVEAHTSKDRSILNSFFSELDYSPVAIAGISDNYFWMPRGSDRAGSQDVVNRSLLEGLRTDYRYSKDILAQVSASRRELQKFIEQLSEPSKGAADVTMDDGAGSLRSVLRDVQRVLEEVIDSAPARDAHAIAWVREELEGLRKEVIQESEARNSDLRRLSREAFTGVADLREELLRMGRHERSTAASLRSGHDQVVSALDAMKVSLQQRDDDTSAKVSDLGDDIGVKLDELKDLITSMEELVSSGLLAVPESGDGSDAEGPVSPAHDVEDGALRDTRSQSDQMDEGTAAGVEVSNAGDSMDSAHTGDTSGLGSEETGESRDGAGELGQLALAYARLARRLERTDPRAWSADALIGAMVRALGLSEAEEQALSDGSGRLLELEALHPDLGLRVRELHQPAPAGRPTRDRVRVGIASMPGREAGLSTVINVLAPQADEIFVYLNNMDTVPRVLPFKNNVRYFTGPDVGDRGKFAFMEGFTGYYITCDDDIEYAPFHVNHIIDGIERYSRQAVVGWHGSNFKSDFKKFYDSNSRQVLSFRFLRGKDTPVHLLGTGVCGFHTGTLDVKYSDFKLPNMADIFLALTAKRQNVPMMVLAHGKDWAKPIDVGPSISTVSLKKDEAPAAQLDVGAAASELVLENKPWRVHDLKADYRRQTFDVAFIGRTDKARWKKGGILKSAHLTVDQLRRFGVGVIHEDIVTGDPRGLGGRKADIVMLYVGDPDRPDFKNIEPLVGHHARAGRKVIVNLSYNGKESRTKFIRAKMAEWRKAFGNNVYLMVFTESLLEAAALQELRECSVVVPKTLVFPDEPVASFRNTSGIFVGDIAKLSDNYLLDYPAAEWLSVMRKSLPGVKLYGVRQYKPKYDVPLDVDEVWPFLDSGSFIERIGAMRLMISMVKYATFEMVPVEVAALGVPVIYPGMAQSLSEHLGIGGVRIDTPAQLGRVLPELYHDPIVWRSFSEAGIHRAQSAELGNTAGQLYVRLLDVMRG